jgi:acyl carrier protein
MRDNDEELRSSIKELIVTSLRLTMAPEEIADDIPLFREGLGLDSIDALELVMEIERVFGVAIDDEHLAQRVLRSVNSIAQFVVERQTGDLSMRSGRTT